jgi:hypothetical protein
MTAREGSQSGTTSDWRRRAGRARAWAAVMEEPHKPRRTALRRKPAGKITRRSSTSSVRNGGHRQAVEQDLQGSQCIGRSQALLPRASTRPMFRGRTCRGGSETTGPISSVAGGAVMRCGTSLYSTAGAPDPAGGPAEDPMDVPRPAGDDQDVRPCDIQVAAGDDQDVRPCDIQVAQLRDAAQAGAPDERGRGR